jgi:hypothetical protein
MDPLPMSEIVARRIKGAFGSTYLTLMSIMQGVALAALATRVAETSGRFDAGDWLVTLDTFLVLVVVWNEYLVAALAFAWIPTFLDSLLPFGLLAAELFLVHAVYGNLHGWLLAMAGASLVSLGALIYTQLRVGTGEAEQRAAFRAIGGHHLLTIVSAAVGALLFLSAGLLYDMAGLASMRSTVLTAATVVIALYLSRAIVSWVRIQRYTHGTSKAS